MPKVRKIVRAVREHKCDFCRSKIAKGERYACSVVKDLYGKYSLKHHIECEHTAALNALAEKDW
jgi:hypothetical protein